MTKKWTAAQLAAIETNNKTLLVSAAAGSGKSTTLTERIIRSLTGEERADISKMLIVTFTRASAADLKDKILEALNDALAKNPSDSHLTSQLVKLGSARICTIDSFYLELIRSNFTELGLSPSFRIADSAEVEILAKSIMNDTIEYFYETDEDFPLFAECFSGIRNSDALIDIFLNLDSHLKSIPAGIDFLKQNAEATSSQATLDFFSTDYGQVLKKQFKDAIEYYLPPTKEACDYIASDEKMAAAYLPAFEYQRELCEKLITACNDIYLGYKAIREILLNNAPPKLKPLKSEFVTPTLETYKELRESFGKEIKSFVKDSFSKEQESITRAMWDTAKYTLILYRLLLEFNLRLDEEKKRRGFLDFSDVRRYTLKLLTDENQEPTPTAKKYAEEFTHIYIDEYQDVDEVQDLIFRSISKPTNRFMVGDIKQSIYSFRGAEPKVFAAYRASFPDHTDKNAKSYDNQAIFMSENFRCDKNVIDFTNLVCSYIFSACSESIGYCESDDLVFSKKSNEDYTSPKVEVAVITLPKKDKQSESEKESDTEELGGDQESSDAKLCEARYIAKEIYSIIGKVKKADDSYIKAGDIAVLSRTKAIHSYVADALREYGIQCSENDSERYFENPDVLMMLCILNAIDNPQRDIFLTGALRSPIFDFSMNDIIRIRRSCDPSHSLYDALEVVANSSLRSSLSEKCSSFISVLSEWRDNAASLPVDKFLRYLFGTDLFIASGLLSSSGDGTYGNILRLYEYARNFENGSFKGLYQFIEFINTLIEEGKVLESPPMTRSPDKVSLMTIHQSKGLEFPVCFLCSTASRFNQSDQKESLLFDYPLGIAMKIADASGFARINTPMRDAIRKNVKIKQTEEEMRVLYVALTRARERLYVTAATKRSSESLLSAAERRSNFYGRHVILECSSYLDWILTSTCKATDDASYNISFIDVSELDAKIVQDQPTDKEKQPETAEINQALYEKLKDKFEFSYPYLDFSRIPAKISVSKLSPDILDEFDTSVPLDAAPEAHRHAQIPDFFLPDKPSSVSAAERGIATHLFLQFCDFAKAKRHGIDEELARLTEKQFIPKNTSALIFKNELDAFLSSELIEKILSAERIIREQRFNILLPTSEFTQNQEFAKKLKGEKLAVQGVIDLIVITEENQILVFDYKTDRLSREELSSYPLAKAKLNKLHAMQLSYYAKAVEMIFGRACDGLFVYSTHAAKLFEIERIPLSPPESIDTL